MAAVVGIFLVFDNIHESGGVNAKIEALHKFALALELVSYVGLATASVSALPITRAYIDGQPQTKAQVAREMSKNFAFKRISYFRIRRGTLLVSQVFVFHMIAHSTYRLLHEIGFFDAAKSGAV